jgi:translocation and assembly module TamA
MVRRIWGWVLTAMLGGAGVCWAQDGVYAPEPAASASAPAALAYGLEVVAPSGLKKLLLSALDLARFQTMARGDASITREEIIRLANAAPAQARSVLETEGYFNAQASVQRSEDAAGLTRLVLRVEPGPRTRVKQVALQVEGPLQTLLEAGDAPSQKLMRQLRGAWTLPVSEPFRQGDWTSAKNSTQALLRARGYPSAIWVNTRAQVDAQQHTAALSGLLQSGPLFRLGELRVVGLSRYGEEAVRNLADFAPGTPYSEKRLLDYQERLGKLGLFESVAVEMDFNPALADASPVTVTVREQHLQQATTGVGYSDKSGPRTTLEHRHRRPFGWAWQSYNKLELGRNLRSWEGELISDPSANRYRKLLAGSVSWLDAADEITTVSRVRAGRSLDTERIERLIFGEVLGNTRRNAAVFERAQAYSINYHWVWRDVDSIVLPTKGLTSVIQFGTGQVVSNFGRSGAFARAYTRNTLYWPLSKQWHTQLRFEAGQVFSPSAVGIPDQLLFRAGGDESVRGYAYRTLGTRKDGVLASGRTLLSTSAELAHPISADIPNVWWAAFIDAGNAANSFRELKLALGYGLGIRVRSPVGPLRVDVAYGEQARRLRVHFSVGIAF